MSIMVDNSRWSMLPGPKWASADEARRWLKAERTRLGWTERDLDRAFTKVAYRSRLFIGDGGGAIFPRATVARVKRFEAGGDEIPDWLFWIPLAIERAKQPAYALDWEHEHVPDHWDHHLEKLENEYAVSDGGIDDEEWALIVMFRQMNEKQRAFLTEIAAFPQQFEFLEALIMREAQSRRGL